MLVLIKEERDEKAGHQNNSQEFKVQKRDIS